MSSDTLEQIFDPFFTTKPAGQDTGLGLSLAQQIIHAHKGVLYAESQLGQGSVFHLLLPASLPDHAAAGAESAPAPAHPACVLLVGDNPRMLAHWSRFLEQRGLSVSDSSWGDLRRRAEEIRPQILVADSGSDQGRALELCMSLRGSCPGVQTILLTDRLTREALQAKQRGTVQNLLEKPVSSQELLQVVESLLRS